MSSIKLLAPSHSLEQRVNDYMRPFHTAICQEHLIGALQQLPKSRTFPKEESNIREQVALRLLQEVIVMGAQEQEALDDCLLACGPLEALSACATTLQEISGGSKSKKKQTYTSSVESPSILETALRTIRRWLVKGVSFPPDRDPSNSYDERCWVEQVTAAMSSHASSHYINPTNANNSPKSNVTGDRYSHLAHACLDSLTKLVLVLSVQIANACHALTMQLPTWAMSSRYNPRLIEGALSMALYQQEVEDFSYSASYFKLLVQHMIRSRNPDDVALGLYKYHERHYRSYKQISNQPKALCQLLLQLHRHTLSPRESAYLLRSIMMSSIPRQSHATKMASTQLTDLWRLHLYPYMELSCRPILVASRKVREAFLRLLVLSPSSVLTEEWPDRLLCHCVASLLANHNPLRTKISDKTRSTVESESSGRSVRSSDHSSNTGGSESSRGDDEDKQQNEALQHHASLAKHVREVIATWSLAVFVRQTDYRLQRHVTSFLLSGMCFLHLHQTNNTVVGGTDASKNGLPASDLVSGLLAGVTVRLESSIPAIRKDGMMVAERLAQKMGQELKFDELDLERSMKDDDDVTFLQSVMTASEFPSHYYTRTPVRTSPRPPLPTPQRPQPRLLQQRREQQQQRHQQTQSPQRPSKGEKEERSKRRKAKREGKSDTRILDAVYYGHMKSTTTTHLQSASGGEMRCTRDSYEDSCTTTEVFNGGDLPPHQEPATPQFYQHAPKTQANKQLKKHIHYLPSPSPKKAQRDGHGRHLAATSSKRRLPNKQSGKTGRTFDSYDSSIDQEDQTCELQSSPPRPPSCRQAQSSQVAQKNTSAQHYETCQKRTVHQDDQDQWMPSHGCGTLGQPAFSVESTEKLGFVQQRQAEEQLQHCGIRRKSEIRHVMEPQTQTSGYNPESNIMHPQGFVELLHDLKLNADPDVTSCDYQQQPLRAPEFASQPDGFCLHGSQQVHLLDPSNDGNYLRGGHHATWAGQQEGSSTHVTRDNQEYVILEPDHVRQKSYWQNQKKQQRRQVHYKQQHTAEGLLQLQLQMHQRQKQLDREQEQKATIEMVTKTPQNQVTSMLQDKQSSLGKDNENEEGATLVVETVEDEDRTDEVELASGEDDNSGVAKCWTHKEVEMVLENNPPYHSELSPLPRGLSRRHSTPRKSLARMSMATKEDNPRRNAEPDEPSSIRERGGDVPSLIFAMIDSDKVSEMGEKKKFPQTYGIEGYTVDQMATERLKSAPVSYGKPPLSPRSRGHYRYNYMRQKKQQSISSSERNQKDSYTSVRSRMHPHVDPAEIDARILATAYDHESVASTNSAPSLSVYSSSSSEGSLYLTDDRARNEASQSATRPPKQAYGNVFEFMKSTGQQRQKNDDNSGQSLPILLEGRTPRAPNKRVFLVDPDAPYVSDEDEDEDDEEYYDDDSRSHEEEDEDDAYSDEGTYTEEGEYNDEDSAWDESEPRLNAYDVEDGEEDLVEAQKPRYLRDCLELLRSSESHKQGHCKYEAVLKWLPQIIQGEEKPTDLPDLAVPLVLELMRMENKFNLDNFEDDKLTSVIALTVEEPLAVGQRLILLLWEDIAFMDRLDVLTVLNEAALELSGKKELDEWRKHVNKNDSVTYGKRAHGKENYSLLSCKDNSTLTGTDAGSIVSVYAERALVQVESTTRRWGRGRRHWETHSFRSRFGPVAHAWYYSLVGGFMQRKGNSSLWGGVIGARLLANMFVTLATIVERAEVAPGADVLAKDLFELVWSFRTVDVAEVRMGVLVAVAAALACLHEEVVLTMMFDGSLSSLPEGLNQMAQSDADGNCRRLALSMSKGIAGIVDSMQPVGKISKLSLSV